MMALDPPALASAERAIAAPVSEHVKLVLERRRDLPAPPWAELLDLRVQSITYQGEFINAYELVDRAGLELPPFTPGAHLDVHLPDGRVRQYSLCGDVDDRTRYRVAVQREAHGRGGSQAMFDRVRPGTVLAVSRPRNHFPLAETAAHHLLLAGGIGITPILAMGKFLAATGGRFTLHYCTRGPERTAFAAELGVLACAGTVHIHHDGGEPSRRLDVEELLRRNQPGTHAYCCGPDGFMGAVARAATHWPHGTIHFERFAPPVRPNGGADAGNGGMSMTSAAQGFRVVLAKSGTTVDVPHDKSIVEALRAQGVEVATSCEAGLCGTCRTRYLEGEPEHRDYILSDEERRSEVLICCARARSPILVLDR